MKANSPLRLVFTRDCDAAGLRRVSCSQGAPQTPTRQAEAAAAAAGGGEEERSLSITLAYSCAGRITSCTNAAASSNAAPTSAAEAAAESRTCAEWPIKMLWFQ